MEEHMGRRTVGGLILTRAGSILVYRDEKETPGHSNKRNHDTAKKCKQVHVQSSQKRNSESSKRVSSTSNAETRGRNVNLAAKINKRVSSSITRTVSQIQGSLRGRNGSSRSGSSSGSSGSSNSIVRKRQEERIGGNGDEMLLPGQQRSSHSHGSRFRINDTRRVPPYYGRNDINSLHASTEDDVTYWSFNIDDTTERFLEQETSSFLDDRSWPDRHREMRMDIDDMSYEELLAFCERIGTVNTGLSDAALLECLERSLYVQTSCSNLLGTKEEGDLKCIVCQEEYKFGEEVAKLSCSHYYHVNCIHQWLRLKNWCPICKALASPST